MADDTTAVYINNLQVFSEATRDGNVYTLCSDYAIGCTAATMATIQIEDLLQLGVNTIRFDVFQRGGGAFGLNYRGELTFAETTPDIQLDEPPTLTTVMLVGLFGIGAFSRRRTIS